MLQLDLQFLSQQAALISTCYIAAAVLKALISLLAALRRHHAKNGMTATMMAQALGPLVLRPEHNPGAQDNMDLVVDEAVSKLMPYYLLWTVTNACHNSALHTL